MEFIISRKSQVRKYMEDLEIQTHLEDTIIKPFREYQDIRSFQMKCPCFIQIKNSYI